MIKSNFKPALELCSESYEIFVNADAFVKILAMYIIKICAYAFGKFNSFIFSFQVCCVKKYGQGEGVAAGMFAYDVCSP